MNHLRDTLSQYWQNIQGSLFPWLTEELGVLTEKQQQLVTVLEVARIEEHMPSERGYPGRPKKSRIALARAFAAKMLYNLSTTRGLLDRLQSDQILRRLCGWERKDQVPHESAFSRAFAEFSESRLPERVHEAVIEKTYGDQIVGHISRDSTQINGREKPENKPKSVQKKKATKRGRPKKGEKRAAKEPTRLERQSEQSLEEMRKELPVACDVGTKQNSKGKREVWIGYKLHIDTADNGIPISCLLTSASVHDSQAAIPLAMMTDQRATNLYDLMDSAYDAPQIHDCSRKLGHVPIIDKNPRRNKELKEDLVAEKKRQKRIGIVSAEVTRYNERSTVERVNGRFKDEFGGRNIRVRGAAKVMCHLMFGILVQTIDQLMKIIR